MTITEAAVMSVTWWHLGGVGAVLRADGVECLRGPGGPAFASDAKALAVTTICRIA